MSDDLYIVSSIIFLFVSFIMSNILKRQPKIGCYRLPIHRRGVHRIFFMIPSYYKIEILAIRALL